jgi:hypothetical protein
LSLIHIAHIGDTRDVPLADILVKRGGFEEHSVHIFDIGNVPIFKALIKA